MVFRYVSEMVGDFRVHITMRVKLNNKIINGATVLRSLTIDRSKKIGTYIYIGIHQNTLNLKVNNNRRERQRLTDETVLCDREIE